MPIYRNLHDVDTDINQIVAKQLIDFSPEYAVRFLDDFFTFNNVTTTGDWVSTLGTGDSITVTDLKNGLITINVSAKDNAPQIQSQAEPFDLSKNMYFVTSLKIDTLASTKLIAGLCETDTSLIGGVDNAVYFYADAGALSFRNAMTGQTTQSVALNKSLVSNTFIKLAFKYDTDYGFQIIINDEVVREIVPSFKTTEPLAVSFAITSTATSSPSRNLVIDYVYVIQER